MPRIRRDHGQERALQIVRRKGAQFEFKLAGSRPFANNGTGLESNHADASAGFKQTADFGLADFSGAHDQALPACQLQKHWETN